MSIYTKVYSPDNEFFEVTRDIADKLILENGWTQNPTVNQKVTTKKSDKDYDTDSVESEE